MSRPTASDLKLRRRTASERAAYFEGRLAAIRARVSEIEGELKVRRIQVRFLVQGIRQAKREHRTMRA